MQREQENNNNEANKRLVKESQQEGTQGKNDAPLQSEDSLSAANMLANSFASLNSHSYNYTAFIRAYKALYQQYTQTNIEPLSDEDLSLFPKKLYEIYEPETDETPINIDPSLRHLSIKSIINQLIWQAITTSPLTWSNVFIQAVEVVCAVTDNQQPAKLRSFIDSSFPQPFKDQLRWLVKVAKTTEVDGLLPLYLPVNLANIPMEWTDILTTTNQHGFTLLHMLVQINQNEWIRSLCKHLPTRVKKALLYKADEKCNSTPLHHAAGNKNTSTLNIAMNTLTDPKHKYRALALQDKQGLTTLHYAAGLGLTGNVSAILDGVENPEDKDALVLKKNILNQTAVDLAAAKGYTDTVIVMLNAISTPLLKIQLVLIAFLRALAYGHTDTVSTLLRVIENIGLDFETVMKLKDPYQRGVLHIAAFHGYTNIVAVLLNAFKNLKRRKEELLMLTDKAGETALHLAVRKNRHQTIATFLNTLEDPVLQIQLLMVTDRFGYHPLHCAAEWGHRNSASALLNNIENPILQFKLIMTKNSFGDNVLHLATQNAHNETIAVILDAIQDPDMKYQLLMAKNTKKQTALDIAKEYNFTQTAALLEEALQYIVYENDSSVVHQSTRTRPRSQQEFPMPAEGIVGQANSSLFTASNEVEELESALKRAKISTEVEDNPLDENKATPNPADNLDNNAFLSLD